MTVNELMDAGAGNGFVVLVIPREPTGERIRLTPTHGPLGMVRCVNKNGHTVALFERAGIRRFVNKHLLKVTDDTSKQ